MYELNIELKYVGLFEKVQLQQATSWCEYELLNKVCDSKREYARGHFNIFAQTYFLFLCVLLVIWGSDNVVKLKPF